MIEKQVVPILRTLAQQQKFVTMRREMFREEVTRLSARLREGDISLSRWQRAMKDEIKSLHGHCAVAAKGGDWDAMTKSDWGRVGRKCRDQYRFLGDFARDVEGKVAGGWEMTTAVDARARLYGGAGRDTYYATLGQQGEMVRWVRNLSDSCPDCIELEAMGWMPYGELRTFPSGDVACDGNCGCELEFGEKHPEVADYYVPVTEPEVMDVFVPESDVMDVAVPAAELETTSFYVPRAG